MSKVDGPQYKAARDCQDFYIGKTMNEHERMNENFMAFGKQSLVWKFSRMRVEIIELFIMKQLKKPRLYSVLL